MEAVLGLFLILLRVSHGMENFCDGRQNEGQCYGPLGGTLVLQLMDKVNDKGTVLLKNSTKTLLEIKQGSIRYYIENKFFFTPDNGTLRINNLSRTDSGEYKVSLYYEGRLNKTQTVNIHVQAPVSSVSFSTECLFLGEMKVSCSSQRGDDPQYSWTLNGSPLTENELLSGNHLNKTITLKQHVHGLLKCSVSNYISHSSYTDQISTCGMENFCDGRQNGAQCYGPLGGTLVLQLMDKVPPGTVLLKNSTQTLLEIKQGSIRYHIENKFFFTLDNGTLRINNLSRTDSGEYKVSLYHEARLSKTQTVNIHVQAPVSSVSFSTECLFLGEMKVSCSSQRGDDPQYSWTLNGSPLTENELLSGNHLNKTITLKQHVHGLLKCSVSNYISHSSYTDQISTCGMENFCDGRQNGAQFYGPLGGTLVLQLMNKVPPGTVLFRNSTQILLEIKQGSIRYYTENKFFFTPDNGTLRINNLSRTDSGEHKVSLYYEGRLIKTQTVNIHVQAPVSSVSFSTVCLFLGEMKVSCSSQRGDDPQYSWTLNGSPLTENELLSGNHLNKTITLKQHVHGLLKCSVSNYISHSSYTDQISTCAYWQVMVALLIARVLLMLVGVFVVITNLKKANNQGKVTAGADDQELTYPATHTLQRRQLKMKTEDEEENDQVFFRGKMRKTAKPIQDEHTNDNVAKREPRQQPH